MSSLTLVATDPKEMAKAQDETVRILEAKVRAIGLDVAQLTTNIELARESGLSTKSLVALRTRRRAALRYYNKLFLAAQDGYYIVPNFPIETFAIRTKKSRPAHIKSLCHWDYMEQGAQKLDADAGEYVSPFPTRRERHIWVTSERDGTKQERKQYVSDQWREPEFPATMVHPEVMKATTKAMRRKVFDEIGLFSNVAGDPMILGKIYGPNYKETSWVIAWWLDPAEL